MGELLGAFSVATFKTSQEDDAAFWSRLIPEEQRPAAAEAAAAVRGAGRVWAGRGLPACLPVA